MLRLFSFIVIIEICLASQHPDQFAQVECIDLCCLMVHLMSSKSAVAVDQGLGTCFNSKNQLTLWNYFMPVPMSSVSLSDSTTAKPSILNPIFALTPNFGSTSSNSETI